MDMDNKKLFNFAPLSKEDGSYVKRPETFHSNYHLSGPIEEQDNGFNDEQRSSYNDAELSSSSSGKGADDDTMHADVFSENISDDPSTSINNNNMKLRPFALRSPKVSVEDEVKDEKYWQYRRKNNLAAKRSRDTKRIKIRAMQMTITELEMAQRELAETCTILKSENIALKTILQDYHRS